MCASGDGERSTQKKKHMHCCGECKGKGTANHFEAELNPQVPPSQECSYKRSRKNWSVNLSIFYRVSVYNPFGFLCQIALVRPYCCNIVQSSLVNHHNHSFNRRIKLANCFQPPAHKGSQIPAQNLRHTSSHAIIQTSKVLQCLRDLRCYNDFFSF